MSQEFEYGFCSGSWWSPTTDLADVGFFGWDPKATTNSAVYQRPQESDSMLEFILPTCWNQVLNGQEDWSPENYSDKPLTNLSKSLAKQQPHNQLHLSNNTPFWNAAADVPSQFLKENSYCNKTNTEPAFKRPRIQTLSPLPTFKVRKEKLGDRITALQQLVSPFGKTDTASVLTEAVEYINFLHEQLGVLSTPCMIKNGAFTHYQEKSDLSSRGLCLVPISIANETSAEMWTPTFPGSYREEEFE